jgi:hypothetical protein
LLFVVVDVIDVVVVIIIILIIIIIVISLRVHSWPSGRQQWK